MLIENYYCEKCKKKTYHKEVRKDFFECESCGYKEIRTTTVNERDIDSNNVVQYLYKSGNYIYYNDSISAVAAKIKDLKALIAGDVIRIPTYRNKKFTMNSHANYSRNLK